MNKLFIFVKVLQFLVCVYLATTSVVAFCHLPDLHQTGMSLTEIHKWVSEGPESEIEENIKLNHIALQTSELALSLFVKCITAASVINFGLMIFEYLCVIGKRKSAIAPSALE